ncbi:MAG TPA: sphingomyelin phosphodiesterase [Chitinophagales bacterium]|nr:sphingomyelin phosphodiesterase [Chitinophagales bacterium]MCB9075738.1 sphingomyelin phosphodiesterase [Chitinophagales bacterium]HMY43293.1 sphingomyelin phosphodiesterase [Chitinophagales bacterium]HMZ69468.1 sphingomyelin phosphodiesterase [Chitinophagales bacterium]HND45200.1 sphingomyelin phosphodiesterase [Chitinophagales bacterium]
MIKIAISFFFILVINFSEAQIMPINPTQLPEQEVALDSLKMLSWNIYMLPPMLKFTGKKKRSIHIANQLLTTDYDLIVFQEAFHRGARRRMVKRMQTDYPYRIGPAFKSNFSIKTSDGIWIMSKFPIEEVDKIKYKAKKGIDRMAKKGALMVKLNKNGQEFYVVGTHLNAAGSDDYRICQLKQLKTELLDKYEKDSLPTIVAGDLNVDKYKRSLYDSMLGILNVNDYKMEGDLQLTYDYTKNTLAYGKSQNWIDYIFLMQHQLKVEDVKREVKIIESPWSKKHQSLSDHHAVEMKLYYKK